MIEVGMHRASEAMLMLGAAILAIAALWHAYWVLGGTSGLASAIPQVDGKPLFVPRRIATAAAGGLIAAVAALYGAAAGEARLSPLPAWLLAALLGLAGLVFILRAVGDFNRVGFFNRGGMTPFAVADRKVYSPLCLFLGLTGVHAASLRLL